MTVYLFSCITPTGAGITIHRIAIEKNNHTDVICFMNPDIRSYSWWQRLCSAVKVSDTRCCLSGSNNELLCFLLQFVCPDSHCKITNTHTPAFCNIRTTMVYFYSWSCCHTCSGQGSLQCGGSFCLLFVQPDVVLSHPAPVRVFTDISEKSQ